MIYVNIHPYIENVLNVMASSISNRITAISDGLISVYIWKVKKWSFPSFWLKVSNGVKAVFTLQSAWYWRWRVWGSCIQIGFSIDCISFWSLFYSKELIKRPALHINELINMKGRWEAERVEISWELKSQKSLQLWASQVLFIAQSFNIKSGKTTVCSGLNKEVHCSIKTGGSPLKQK